MFLVISYDITDDHRRNRVAKTLEDYGRRVQYSVFDCLLDESDLFELQHKLQQIIDFETDSIRFYRLCKRCQNSIEVMGSGTIQQDTPFRII